MTLEDLARDAIAREIADGYAEKTAVRRTADNLEELHAADRAEAVRLAEEALQWHLGARTGVTRIREMDALAVSQLPSWYVGALGGHKHWPGVRNRLGAALGAADIERIDSFTDRLVAACACPWRKGPNGPEGTRHHIGLVMGHVQSGKTATFLAASAKALDQGYRVIVIASGMTDSLRRQTYQRLRADLKGASFAPERLLEVTGEEQDFAGNTMTAASLLHGRNTHALVLVVKKNRRVLDKLVAWLEPLAAMTPEPPPLLVIDDEADEASLNTGRKKRSAINEAMATLSGLLPTTSYVAVTATPFANLLADARDPKSLYPRHFILPMQPGETYFGAERLFGRDVYPFEGDDALSIDGLDVFRDIPQAERSRVEETLDGAAQLAHAMDWFLLSCGIRELRGDAGRHMSMLVHTSSLKSDHARIRGPIESHLDVLRRLDDAGFAARLREAWDREYGRVDSFPEDGVLPAVDRDTAMRAARTVLGRLEVKVVNMDAGALEYDPAKPARYLVIGGNILSRGLTVEGLVVSYFLRAPRAFDTLMQMGRWFGYRARYGDLVRIWMPKDIQRYYRDVASIEAELRRDLKRYADEGLEPMRIAPRLRTHRDMLLTSRAKVGSNVEPVHLGLGGAELPLLWVPAADGTWLNANWQAAEELIRAIGNPIATKAGESLVWRGVAPATVRTFIQAFRFPELGDARLRRDPLDGFAARSAEKQAITDWNVVVMSGPVGRTAETLGGLAIPTIRRSRYKWTSTEAFAHLKALTSEGDAAVDLELTEAEREELRRSSSRRPLIGRWRDQKAPKTGLLILYLIERTSAPNEKAKDRLPLNAQGPVVAPCFVFPSTDEISDVYYQTKLPTMVADGLEDEEDDDETTDVATETSS